MSVYKVFPELNEAFIRHNEAFYIRVQLKSFCPIPENGPYGVISLQLWLGPLCRMLSPSIWHFHGLASATITLCHSIRNEHCKLNLDEKLKNKLNYQIWSVMYASWSHTICDYVVMSVSMWLVNTLNGPILSCMCFDEFVHVEKVRASPYFSVPLVYAGSLLCHLVCFRMPRCQRKWQGSQTRFWNWLCMKRKSWIKQMGMCPVLLTHP